MFWSRPKPPPSPAPLDATNAQRLAALVRAGEKIEAIKLVREVTGCGLREAKEAVELLERDPTGGLALPQPPVAQDWEGEIRGLLKVGEKIAAIKLYRERTGAGLKDAKDAVERMEREAL